MISRTPRVDGRIRRIQQLLSERHSAPPALDELAAAINLSVSRMQHLFKNQTGIALNRYMNDLRMTKAKALLESSFLSVKEISAQSGWSSQSAFSREFRSRFGVSPAQYRLQAKFAAPPPRLSREAARDSRIGTTIAIFAQSLCLPAC